MSFLRRLGAFIFNRTMLIIIGLVFLSLLCWFVGPLIAIAEWYPLASERLRWLLILAIWFVFLIKIFITWWLRRGINSKVLTFLEKSRNDNEKKTEAPAEREVAELTERFQLALSTLKKTGLQTKGGQSWFSGFGRQFVYELPWYMFIGAPGSGKTTALTHAGLTFPLEEKLGKGAVKGVGGTRNCDWWFTNETVLLDTAGRYTTQESNQALDKSEWTGFLRLLKKYRPKQPLNGALLTISTQDLLTMEPTQRAKHAAALKARLYELSETLQIQFPVYVVVTKLDLLTGFNEYFYHLDKEERAQVLGATFAYDGRNDLANLTANIKEEFDLLSKRLFDGQNAILLKETDLSRRSLAYSFPQQFHGLRDILCEFLGEVFVESKYGEQPLVRGIYFTSGVQEGSPIDRVLGSIAKAFRFEPSIRSSLIQQSQGRSYFLQDLLRKVIFPEAHLAGRNWKWERRFFWIRRGAMVLCACALITSVLSWIWSYNNNQSYLQEVSDRVGTANQSIQRISKTPDADILSLSLLLDQVHDVPDSRNFSVDKPSLGYTYGLYQGWKMEAATSVAYRRILEDGLLPLIAKQIESWLRNPQQANNHELQYETLKAYLMLQENQHYDAEFLKTFAGHVVTQELSPDVTKEQIERIQFHVDHLFGEQVVSSPFPKDDVLIRQIRERLAVFSVGQLSYLRLKRRLEHNELGDFSVVKAAGPQASLVFQFNSKKPITNGVPGLFSYRGYHELFKKEVESVATKFAAEENWVLDPPSSSVKQRLEDFSKDNLVREVKRLYLNEYADTWDVFLKDVELVSPKDLQQSIQLARYMSAPDSPLSLFIKSVSKETTLFRQEKNDNQSIVGRTIERAKSTKNDIERVIGTNALSGVISPKEHLELIVDNRFESLRRLAQNPNGQGAPPIDAVVLPLINELYTALVANDAALKSGNQPPQSDTGNKMRAEAARLPSPVRDLLIGLSDAGVSQTAGVVRAAISANIDASIGQFCRRAIAGRYPFSRGTNQEVTPGDFAQLFATGGLMDEFFQRNLAAIADISTNPWSYKRGPDGMAVGGSGSLIAFQRAQTIRDVFFRDRGRIPSVSFSIKPVEMDDSITQATLDVDGQILKYAHGPQLAQNMIWPGPKGSNQVRMQLSPQQGQQSGLSADGAWALHRFFERAQIQSGSGAERFFATVAIEGRKVKFEIISSSVQNPFNLRAVHEFSCPG